MSELDKVARRPQEPVMPGANLAESLDHTDAKSAATAGAARLIEHGITGAYRPKGVQQEAGNEMALVVDDSKKTAKPADDSHLTDAQKKEIDRKTLKTSLEKEFKVTIKESGTVDFFTDKNLKCRPATKDELLALKQALTKAHPAQMIDKDKGATFIFVEDTKEMDLKQLHGNFAAFNHHGTIIMHHDLDDKNILETEDLGLQNKPNERCLSDLIKHEIAHTLDTANGSRAFDDDLAGEAASRYGYRRGAKIKTVDDVILHKFFQKATDGHYYNEDGTQCDENGRPILNQKGELVNLSSEQLQEVAVVSPVTLYFDTPYEKKAEGMMFLWRGGAARAYLYTYKRELYDLVVKDDQAWIDKLKGSGTYIRNPYGGLLPDTPTNRDKVKEFERNAPAMAKPFELKAKKKASA